MIEAYAADLEVRTLTAAICKTAPKSPESSWFKVPF